MRPRISVFVLVAIVLALGMAVAPDTAAKGPSPRVTIVGPGLDGGIEIVGDLALLERLSIGFLEDFQLPLDPPPQVGPGFELTRFYEVSPGQYQPFDVTIYYPAPAGEPGAIHYQGIVNGWSEYDGRWYGLHPDSEAALRDVLAAHGATLDAIAIEIAPYLAMSSADGALRLLDPVTLEPAGTWQLQGQTGARDPEILKVITGTQGDSLYLATQDNMGTPGAVRLDVANARACPLKLPGELIAVAPDGENLIVAGTSSESAEGALSPALEMRDIETLGLAAAFPIPDAYSAAQHGSSPDGRRILTLQHSDEETALAVFDTYWRAYVASRRLASNADSAAYRITWDATYGTVYVVDGQRVHRFEPLSLEFNPYNGFALVDQDHQPLSEPSAVFEIAGARDGLLYLYRHAESGSPTQTGGIYRVSVALGRLNRHLWPTLPLAQAILHNDTIFALEARRTPTLWVLDPASGAQQRISLEPGEWRLSLVWLDPAALPGGEQPIRLAGCDFRR